MAIGDAYNTFWDAVTATRNQVNKVSPGKWVWITETGWPVSGNANTGGGVANVPNAQKYWKTGGCSLMKSTHMFWYSYQDYKSSPSFGVFDSNGNAIYDLTAC